MSEDTRERPKPNGWFGESRGFVLEEDERVNRPNLTAEEILDWADAHFERTGQWPTKSSGRILEASQETWMTVENALSFGLRGLPGGTTLARFLMEHGARYHRRSGYRITEEDVLEWADAWRERTGAWPHAVPSEIPETPGLTWTCINRALRLGGKGLPGGSSLAQLLASRRGVRNAARPPRLTVEQVLEWADAHFGREGDWPRTESGAIPEAAAETWRAIDKALRMGRRGLPGGSSLRRLLAQERGAVAFEDPPTLTVELILGWADYWHERTGDWPSQRCHSERVPGPSGLRWGFVDDALRYGRCGLPGGSTLAKLLEDQRGARRYRRKPAIRQEEILQWADEHFWRTGRWPTRDSGPVFNRPQLTWNEIQLCLMLGRRGLPGGSSLARFLAEHRGKRNRKDLASLRIDQVLAWADAFRERTGQWPNLQSGPIPEAPGETWHAVQAALSNGCRGFPGGSSLARLLAEHRGVYNPHGDRVLTPEQILAWADAWHAREHAWPTRRSGAIPGAGGITWGAVHEALQKGRLGLPGGSTLRRFLAQRRDVPRPERRSRLTEEQILAWADEHYRRFHRWPKVLSGSVFGAEDEAWHLIDTALRQGLRGLPGGSSIACLLATRRGERNPKAPPPLTEEQILAWADAFHERSGTWPNADSGPIVDSPGETWCAVDSALRAGRRGLAGGSSLFRLLTEKRRVGTRSIHEGGCITLKPAQGRV